ncbi:hypothetical protein [Cohnella thailandensis]|uniref:hypothetical protein n=1 Tax=Cohnella thailandensis TaxID=557557 RepID=UPI001DB03DB7|nr:hypothetical protein [Cohnella thailandensis]
MTTIPIEERLKQLGIRLPEASEPVAKYANFVVVNGLMFVSGKGPAGNPKGKLGIEYRGFNLPGGRDRIR